MIAWFNLLYCTVYYFISSFYFSVETVCVETLLGVIPVLPYHLPYH